MSGRSIVVRLAVTALFCFAALSGRAARAATVAIVSSDTTPALSEAASRLRGELMALRLQIVMLGRPSAAELGELDHREWLEKTAETLDVDAAIEVIGEKAPLAADVWTFQRSPRRAQVARVVLAENTVDRAGTLAIRAIEVLRSSSLEADLAAKARQRDEGARGEPPLPEVADQVTMTPRPGAAPRVGEVFSIELGALVMLSAGGVGPAITPMVRADWRASSALLVQATGAGFGTRPTLRSSAGTARISHGYAVLALCYCPLTSSRLSPYVALGAGTLRVGLTGAAELPARGHALAQWSLLLDAGAGARLRLTERFYATLTGHLQVTEPAIAIHIADEQVARTGRPTLLNQLTLGAWL